MTWVMADSRAETCRSRDGITVRLEVCGQHDNTAYRDNNNGTHTLVCRYCSRPTDKTENHSFTDNVCVCGREQPVFTVETVPDRTYNGQATAFTVKDGDKTLSLGEDYTVSYKKGGEAAAQAKDAGEYTAVVTGINGYAGAEAAEVKFSVKKKALTVTTGSAEKPYDGTALTNADAKVTGLAEGETVTVTATGSRTQVGESKNTYSIKWGKTNKDNYTVTEKLGKLTVKENNFTVTWKDYDGSEIDKATVQYGAVPAHAGPEREADGDYIYTFGGWNPKPAAVTADISYTAQYSKTARKYGEPSWSWTGNDKDGYTAARAEFKTADGAAEFAKTVEARVTSKTTEPGYGRDGSTEYTASAVFGGKTYTAEKTVVVPALDARDVNGDGKLDAEDGVYLLSNRLFGGEAYPLPAEDETVYDFNGDGAFNVNDSAYLLNDTGLPEGKEGSVIIASYDEAGRMTRALLLKADSAFTAEDFSALKEAKTVKYIFVDMGFRPASEAPEKTLKNG